MRGNPKVRHQSAARRIALEFISSGTFFFIQ
jgi:hypothetical protein